MAILNLVEVLDQQVSAARRIAEQGEHFVARGRLNAAALRRGAHAAPFLSRGNA
jgi:hypothetical protein